VVLVDIQIAICPELQIEATMVRKQLEHVIEQANARRNFVAAFAFDREFEPDLRFFRVALD
jgi:hypothetical protein